MDVCDEDTKNSTDKVDEVPRKKLKKCEEEQISKKENEVNVFIKTEPSVKEEKRTLPEEMDQCTSNEQFLQNDISTTFPETPPSFEHDPSEPEMGELAK